MLNLFAHFFFFSVPLLKVHWRGTMEENFGTIVLIFFCSFDNNSFTTWMLSLSKCNLWDVISCINYQIWAVRNSTRKTENNGNREWEIFWYQSIWSWNGWDKAYRAHIAPQSIGISFRGMEQVISVLLWRIAIGISCT